MGTTTSYLRWIVAVTISQGLLHLPTYHIHHTILCRPQFLVLTLLQSKAPGTCISLSTTSTQICLGHQQHSFSVGSLPAVERSCCLDSTTMRRLRYVSVSGSCLTILVHFVSPLACFLSCSLLLKFLPRLHGFPQSLAGRTSGVPGRAKVGCSCDASLLWARVMLVA